MEGKGETFAVYLAKQYVSKKGFKSGTVPEAGALASAADIVLTLADGLRFEIACIVDREANPGKRFALSRDALDEIGKSCLKYSGKMGRTRLPVSIRVIEVGPGSDADRERIKGFKRRGIFSKVHLSGWIVDTAGASVWSNAAFGGRLIGAKFIEGLLKGPRETDADLRRPAPALPAQSRFPLLTFALLAVLAGVFACEIVYGIGPWKGLLAPDILTLVAMGGLYPRLVVQSGEWYRVLTAAFLHADAVHLVLNGVALYMAGVALESLVGRVWFLALFLIGAVGGSILSLLINPPTLISVGASGAIMGLLAAAYVCSFRYPPAAGRMQIQMSLLQVLIPSLIPIAVTRTGQQIDFAAHIGGAITGAVAGWLLLKTWSEASRAPRFTGLAATVCAAGVVALALAAAPLRIHYGDYELETFLIPRNQIPKTTEEWKSRSADLVARYPRDPRSRLLRASALIDSRDTAGAEQQLRAGLKEEQILKTKFSNDLEFRLRTMLAAVLFDKGDPAEALSVARPVCAATASPMRETLVKIQLCN